MIPRRFKTLARVLALALLAGSIVSFVRAWSAASAAPVKHTQQEIVDSNVAYARRLRADGDRLEREGLYQDALARYEQAEDYDREPLSGEDAATYQRLRQRVGDLVFDSTPEAGVGR